MTPLRPRTRRLPSVLAAAFAAVLGWSDPAQAQVDWSGGNWPPHDGVVDAGQPVVFFYQIYDAGRTEAPGRGPGLGAALFYRDAGAAGPFTQLPMQYAGQAGMDGHDDLFTITVPAVQFGGASRLEYFTVAYDSLTEPVHADTTQGDQNSHLPNFLFTFGQATMPHGVYVHFGICLNGRAASSVAVLVDPDGSGTWYPFQLTRVSPDQIPDLWECDLLFAPGVLQMLPYRYAADFVLEPGSGPPMTRHLTLQVGSYLQGAATDSWADGPLGCHLGETLAEPRRVHFSVCMAGLAYSGNVCLSGNVPELGNFTSSVVLQPLQGATNPDLFEGDVEFAAGGPAVVQYKFQRDDCASWEDLYGGYSQTTNRFLYLGAASGVFVAPTGVWSNAGPNLCGPPTGVAPRTWSDVKSLYR